MRFALQWLALLSALAALSAAPANAQERVALVIGNAAYTHGPKLTTPVNDADDLGAALDRIGFDVTVATDLDSKAMAQRLRDFSTRLGRAKVALFYFSGRGAQIDGMVQLAGTDLPSPADAKFTQSMLALPALTAAMAGPDRHVVILIDASRDNPLPARRAGSAPGNTSDPVGTLIGFATAPGTVVQDSRGRNSLYASALIKHLPARGADIARVMRLVRDDVMQASGGRQIPWFHASLQGDFTLAPAQ